MEETLEDSCGFARNSLTRRSIERLSLELWRVTKFILSNHSRMVVQNDANFGVESVGENKILIVHDWDFPLYKRRTCLKRAFWLIVYALFGRSKRVREKMPKWMLEEKHGYALALIKIDRYFGVNSIFGLTKEVKEHFPLVESEISTLGFEVRDHYHVRQREVGRGRWRPPIEMSGENMVYDRLYSLQGKRELPREGESVVWHVDHPFNLQYYIEFLERCKEKGLI